MPNSLSWNKIIRKTVMYAVLVLIGAFCMLPLYWLIRSSFMKSTDIYIVDPLILWPKKMLWANYSEAIKFMSFFQKTSNTLLIVAGNMIGCAVTSSMAAYAFSRVSWKGRQICFFALLTSMMLPGTVTIIPQYLIWTRIGFRDSYVPLILPAFLGGGAFNIFLLRQFFLGIPKDLDEAAKIDGASHVRIFIQIIVPLAKSAVTVICLFTFLYHWNDFFGPLIYINSHNKFTLALGLLQFRGNYATKWNWMMAASTIVVIPCIIMYIFAQRRLIEGIALTGLKT
ncbi:sugar ABC transporter permease [Spirochaetia bacterium]|nr:sugar ABC transporter permease [Spirochaetia bacterium]